MGHTAVAFSVAFTHQVFSEEGVDSKPQLTYPAGHFPPTVKLVPLVTLRKGSPPLAPQTLYPFN